MNTQEKGYDIIALMPGNNKNTLAEIDRLVEPILNNKADYVQGCAIYRVAEETTPPVQIGHGQDFGSYTQCHNRQEDHRLHGRFQSIQALHFGRSRYRHLSRLVRPLRLRNLPLFKITYGRKYRYKEVPISKLYPKNKVTIFNPKGVKYSKIKPIVDWWDILRPIPFLLFGIKK